MVLVSLNEFRYTGDFGIPGFWGKAGPRTDQKPNGLLVHRGCWYTQVLWKTRAVLADLGF